MPTPGSSTPSLPTSKASTSAATNSTSEDPDAPGAPISVEDSGHHDEGGKLKLIVQLLKKALGVKDIAAMRLSLPASLMDPIPNLEYWHYLDRPDLFISINDHPDQLQRMLAVLRYVFSKDLKFVKTKICKPYNSVLGEHFRSHYDVPINAVTYADDESTEAPTFSWHYDTDPNNTPAPVMSVDPHLKSPSSASLSIKSVKGGQTGAVLGDHQYAESTPNLGVETHASSKAPSVLEGDKEDAPTPGAPHHRVVFLTEQVSHHPPVSSFYMGCPSKGIEGCGVDQISAKVAGTSLKITPGNFHKGIFVRITKGHGAGEEYKFTLPSAAVNGILRGSFYGTILEHSIITCTNPIGENLRVIIEYKEEPWLGQPKFLLEGVIHKYNPAAPEQNEWIKVKQVPKDLVVATFEGSWRKLITWKLAGSTQSYPLIDLNPLNVVPKHVRPLEEQLPNESRKLWDGVTSNLLKKEYSEATRIKQQIEQKQRDLAAERKRTNTPFVPVYFDPDISSGAPTLTAEGKRIVDEMLSAP